MKTPASLVALGAALLLVAGPVHSQTSKLTAEQQLQAMKEQNVKLLQQQATALEKLDGVLKDAQQLRTFARRS